jgi:DNA-binding response OmpR family regulator
VKVAAQGSYAPRSAKSGQHVILLISDDAALGEDLRRAAEQMKRSVVRVEGLAEAVRSVRVVRPAAVVIDLELPLQAAWATADCLLQEQSCPPLILLTLRSDQVDMSTAIDAGSIIDKSAGPNCLLERVDQILAGQDSGQFERNAAQQVLIRWLKPCAWSPPVTPAQRFWGINE